MKEWPYRSDHMKEIERQLKEDGEVYIMIGPKRNNAPARKRIYLAAQRLKVRVETRKEIVDGVECIHGIVIRRDAFGYWNWRKKEWVVVREAMPLKPKKRKKYAQPEWRHKKAKVHDPDAGS